MSATKEIAKWLTRYILATITILAATAGGAWLYAMLTQRSFVVTFFWVLLGVGLFLIFLGIASGLSTSEYVYIRQGAINPLVMREGMEHFRRGSEKRGMGILLGVVGLTIIFIWLVMYFH
jgi:hypothetical protein